MKSEHYDVCFVVTDKKVGCVCEQNFKLKSKTNSLAPPFKSNEESTIEMRCTPLATYVAVFYPLKNGKNSWFIFMGEKHFNVLRVTVVQPGLISRSPFLLHIFFVSNYINTGNNSLKVC